MRRRQIEHNHCGQPCKGFLTETAKFELEDNCRAKGKAARHGKIDVSSEDCKFGAWSAWSSCHNEKALA